MRMAGVPESSFEHWASRFLSLGHRVARVDQTETSIGKMLRETEEGKREKVLSVFYNLR